jgi:hypothetical protein
MDIAPIARIDIPRQLEIVPPSTSTVSHVLTCSKSLSIGVLREFYVDKRFTEGA